MGHWLNLRHIWGDASCGSDLVTDTPTQQTSNYGCHSFPKVTCSNGPNGDLHMNYMDYTNDACMYMFTTGQKTRMLASLNTTRASLLTSQGCVPPVAGSCGVPASLSASAVTTSTATLNWGAVSGATSYNVQHKATSSATWIAGTSTVTSRAISGLTAGTSYEFQVKANCATSSSAFSASSTFSTPATSCTDIYESNGSRTAAKTISVNANITATIGTSTDNDWFKFTTVAGATNIKVVLSQLPLDYDLTLYNSAGTQLAISQLGGTSTETIIRNTTSAATYYVKVIGYSGVFSTTSCYNLIVNASSSTFRSSELTEYTEGNINAQKLNNSSELILYPNPAQDLIQVNFFNEENSIVEISMIDLLGKVIESKSVDATEGFNTTEMNTSSLQNGIYLLRVVQDGDVQIRKFIVKH